MDGCLKLLSSLIHCRSPLTLSHLHTVIAHYRTSSPSHDDLLFVAMLLTGFFALLCLGEMVFPDDVQTCEWWKVTQHHTVSLLPGRYEYVLSYHKADRLYSGNQVLITKGSSDPNPVDHFDTYLHSRDSLFPLHSPLWLRSNGQVPTCSFFIHRLATFFGSDIHGQSMHARGATFLAEHGVAPSHAFLTYIRKNPALLINLLASL